MELVENAAGRLVPTEINGTPAVPYQGVGGFRPEGRKASAPIRSAGDYPADGDKRVGSIKEALQEAGLRDGMTISSHHHFRNGDLLMVPVFDAAAQLGVKNLRWFPSAAFPCHEPLIKHLESGVIGWIEGSLNGPLGRYASEGKMKGLAVLRSHGGRWQAVQDGEVHIDIAVIAAPTADAFGNATGDRGPSACGLLGFGLVDSIYADRSIVVTDNLVPFPCVPWQIMGQNIDYVVEVDKVGDPAKIVSGTTRLTRSPDRLYIAELTAKFVRAAGIMQDGFSFQAGAGGTALAFATYLREMMIAAGVKARFIRGGSTKYLVEMLEEGLTDYILDGQTFDLDGVRSMRENINHIDTSPFTSYNWHGKGNFASMIDAVVLGATEVDVHFNANVVTHSDGAMLHGIGGWQNCLAAKCTILPIPAFRDRIPIIVDKVTTLCGPGELIDVVITERGIAINPLRKDLIAATKNSGLPIKPIEQIKAEVDALVGGPPNKPHFTDDLVGIIKWVDGTVIDSVFKVAGD
ncbi:MAG: citrate lyase subunit alpha [Candidatus Marinimicrobia bacterium]|nr:citrate lyase subunit alpha [Candidatus Neomarinimicrobiota bacterium]